MEVFQRHFEDLQRYYGRVLIASLLEVRRYPLLRRYSLVADSSVCWSADVAGEAGAATGHRLRKRHPLHAQVP